MENNNDLSYEKEFGFENEITDSKGRKHSDYIHQDYRSIDGYCTEESSFIANEIMYREDYDYYTDKYNKALSKVDKETNEVYEFIINQSGDNLSEDWMINNDIDNLEEMIQLDNFQKVIDIIVEYVSDVEKKSSEYNEEDYLFLTQTDYQAISLDDANYINNKGANLYNVNEYSQAIEYYRLAAAMGDTHAVSNLGYCYLYGRSIEPNISLAIGYFQIAAKRGDIDAAYKLGDIYGSNKWGLEDYEMSVYYYRMSASYILGDDWDEQMIDFCDVLQNYPSLCYALGREMSDEGHMCTDVEKSYQFLLHAKYGYEKAINNGNSMYENTYDSLNKFMSKNLYDSVREKYNNAFIELYENNDKEDE